MLGCAFPSDRDQIASIHGAQGGSMRKSKTVRINAKKIIRPKLGRTMLRPLGLAELEHVPGAADVETDGVWTNHLEGDGSSY
jgi:hypothetical protein